MPMQDELVPEETIVRPAFTRRPCKTFNPGQAIKKTDKIEGKIFRNGIEVWSTDVYDPNDATFPAPGRKLTLRADFRIKEVIDTDYSPE